MLRQAARTAARGVRAAGAPSRGYAGAGHGHGDGVTYGGLTVHPPAAWHVNVATGLSALMWFWVLLRWKEDGATLLFGHAPHFEHDIAEERKAEAEALLYKPRPAAG